MAHLTFDGPTSDLLEQTRSYAKKRGHALATTVHLALVFVRSEPDAIAALGPEARAALAQDALEARLSGTPKEYVQPDLGQDVLALATAAQSGPGTAVERVAAALAAWVLDEGASPQQAAEASTDATRGEPRESHPVLESAVGPASSLTAGAGSVKAPPLRELTQTVAPNAAIIGRTGVVEMILNHLRMRTPATPLVTAPEGAGRTSLAEAIASRLGALPTSDALSGYSVVRVNADQAILGGGAKALNQVIGQAGSRTIVVVDDLEVLANLGSTVTANPDVLTVLRSAVDRSDRKVVLTLAEGYAERLRVLDRELVEELHGVDLPVLEEEDVLAIAAAHATELADHHGVELRPEVVALACGAPLETDRVVQPSLALLRLDRAAATASAAGRAVEPSDIPGRRGAATFDAAATTAALRAAVIGQDHVVERVVDRLLVTRAQLDAAPHRPDGVFLFAGPTGVGKTSLAQALAEQVYGSSEAVIRLDMSEFAQEHNVSRLVGSPPGYVGSTDPDSWLTTRIRRNGSVVLLLDEIEKAHPRVWQTFLQVFDAGRLTDGQGVVADFRDTVVILTSNMGSEAFRSGPSVGFGDGALPSVEADEKGVVRRIKETMTPELLNRLDDILVFRPLGSDTVREIAARDVERLVARLRSRGYELTVDDAVVDLVAAEGYSREYGARQLGRVLEREVLQRVIKLPAGAYVVEAVEGVVQVRAATSPTVG